MEGEPERAKDEMLCKSKMHIFETNSTIQLSSLICKFNNAFFAESDQVCINSGIYWVI